jgi:hypothetical protein
MSVSAAILDADVEACLERVETALDGLLGLPVRTVSAPPQPERLRTRMVSGVLPNAKASRSLRSR